MSVRTRSLGAAVALLALSVFDLTMPATAYSTPAASQTPTGDESSVSLLLAPTADPAAVAEVAEDHGLAVVDSTSASLTVSGPSALLTQWFGARAAGVDSGTEVAPGSAAALDASRSLSRVPEFLTGLVDQALPTDPGPAAFTPAAARSGADLRNADTNAGGAAISTAASSKATVATIQFARGDSADLTRAASDAGLPDPVSSGQYVAVDVDGGAPVDDGGAFEVALDQQALLATATGASQRAYFAPNSLAGFVDSFNRIADDAAAYNITALSISWGSCEANFGSAAQATMESGLKRLAAAGVTVFAASGDHGVYDCGGSVGVDYPASSPQVVSVGGTTLSPVGYGGSNNGLNWSETAWSCASSSSCVSGAGGTGGGASRSAQPAYQSRNLSGSYLSGRRLVPDLANVGDSATGMITYFGGKRYLGGGTSLSAPVTAALLVNAMTASGYTCGVGQIHDVLYARAAATQGLAASDGARAFRDVTSGSNGAQTDRGSGNPSTSAGAGYDTVSGLGVALWPALTGSLGTLTSRRGCAAPPYTPGAVTAPSSVGRAQAVANLRMIGKRKARGGKARALATWTISNPAAARDVQVQVLAVTRGKSRVLWRGSAVAGQVTVRLHDTVRRRLAILVSYADGAGAQSARAAVRTGRHR